MLALPGAAAVSGGLMPARRLVSSAMNPYPLGAGLDLPLDGVTDTQFTVIQDFSKRAATPA